MTSDSQHVPRHVEQSGLEYEFPRGIEYQDIKSLSHSDLTDMSRLLSGPLPPVDFLRRGVKSFDDLGKALKQSNRRLERIANLPSPDFQRKGIKSRDDFLKASKLRHDRQEKIANPSPICSTYSGSTASNLGDRTEATFGVEKICESCLGLNAENLAQPGGYKHSMLSKLFKSRKWCKICYLLAKLLQLYTMNERTSDRYQIVVSLRETSDYVEVRPGSTHHRRSRSNKGHDHVRTDFLDNFSKLVVEVIDLCSWKASEYIGHLHSYVPPESSQTFLAPDGSKWRIVRSRQLFCLTEEHDPATEFGVEYVRQIGSNTSSSYSFDIAAEWLASCLSTRNPSRLDEWKSPLDYDYEDIERYRGHEAGGFQVVASHNEAESLIAQNPLRLVEIQQGARENVPTVRVIHTDGHHYTYAALSYCWGKAPPGDDRLWQTTQATLKGYMKDINVRHLPQTLKDAIHICERLHIFYLWVDSLCIIQDSPSDWAAEAAKMSGIYLGSLLTISLSTSVSAESGCFNNVSQAVVEDEEYDHATIDSRFKDGRSSRLYITRYPRHLSLFDDEVRHGVLAERAWALQEHIMPQRTLYFTSKQLLWECKHCRLSEDKYPQRQADRLYPILDYGFRLDATAIVEMWYQRVVQDYTRRQLTYEKDKLIAISALARATYINRQVDYVAGLWRDCIVPGLLWARKGPGSKSRTYSCPTWSWASQNSAVAYLFPTPSMYTAKPSVLLPRVQDVSWATKPENPFGDVLFAHVDLETTIALVTVLRDDAFIEWQPLIGTYETQTLIILGRGQAGPICAFATMDDADRGGRNVLAANMGHCFLLLEPPSLNSREYRRVGIAAVYSSPQYGKWACMDDISCGWTQRTIRLV